MSIEIRELNEYDMRDYGVELTRLFNYLHPSENQKLVDWFVWFKAWGKVYGVFDNDKLVGMASVILIPKPYGFVAQLEDVAVLENFRNKDIGAQLIKHIERLAKFHGWAYKITLSCDDGVKPFYEKLGYYDGAHYMRKDI